MKKKPETISGKLADALRKIEFVDMNNKVRTSISVKPCSDLTIDTIDRSASILSNRMTGERWEIKGDIKRCDRSMQPQDPDFDRKGMNIIIDDKNKRVVTVSDDDKGQYIVIFNALTADERIKEAQSADLSDFATALAMVTAHEIFNEVGKVPLKDGRIDFNEVDRLLSQERAS